MKDYYVYIIANEKEVPDLYVGMTNSLGRRLMEHRLGLVDGYSKRRGIKRLVYYRAFRTPMQAIRAEKEIKSWVRWKKLALIHAFNPSWQDLSEGWQSN